MKLTVRMALSAVCISTLVAMSVQANGLEPSTSLNAKKHPGLIYSYDEMFNFDIEQYLASRAPALLPHAEVISHWAGYTSISPKLLIALMEQQTGLISNKRISTDTLQRPFGTLSAKRGFAEQVQDVSDQLATMLYAQVNRHEGVSEFGGELSLSKAANPLELLLSRDAQNIADTGDANAKISAKAKPSINAVYFKLFGTELDTGAEASANQGPEVMAATPPNGFLQFPFPRGQTWYIGGAHTNTGQGNYPMSSLDMNNGGYWGGSQANNWVSASAAGTFKRHSSCFAEVVHSSGWSTTYYHLQNIQYSTGASVAKNTAIANPASTKAQALCNGGSSTGPHQHWSLKYNGSWHHLNTVILAGYTITAIGSSYDTNCSRYYLTKNGSKYCAGRFYNP